MVQTMSAMLPLGTKAPAFRLPDPNGKSVSSKDFDSAPALLIAFICNHCPYVKHIRPSFAEMAKKYQAVFEGQRFEFCVNMALRVE